MCVCVCVCNNNNNYYYIKRFIDDGSPGAENIQIKILWENGMRVQLRGETRGKERRGGVQCVGVGAACSCPPCAGQVLSPRYNTQVIKGIRAQVIARVQAEAVSVFTQGMG